MYSYSREMIAYKLIHIFVALLSLQTCLTNAANNIRNRRRPSLSSAKQTVNEVTDKTEAIPDQIALAAGNSKANQYRNGNSYGSKGGDYLYGNLEMNLIRPESEQSLRMVPHTQITTQYTSSISTSAQREMDAQRELDNSETAEEYVAKAMQMYGTRLREPIRIPSETETQQANAISQQQQLSISSSGSNTINNNPNYDYYELANKQLQPQPQSISQQQQADQNQYLEAQQQAELQAQLQQAQQQLVEQQQQQLQQEQEQLNSQQQQQQQVQQQQLEVQTERGQLAPTSQHPAPTFEKDPVTRSYEVYDETAASYDGSTQDVDRQYRPKYHYQTAYRDEQEDERNRLAEENIRVSASTEIPKAEIMKQIEKSVMKYMKELEAEGKIIATPQEQNTYYKMVPVPEKSEEKRVTSTTYKPKYISSSPSPNYHAKYSGSSSSLSSASPSGQSLNSGGNSYTRLHHKTKHSPKQHYQSEAEDTFQSSALPQQEISDALAPNVEFIYKIKTRAPLQTATVKTVSKPYSLPLKATYDQFDHSAALKNLEDFDLSHVVTTQDPEEHPVSIHGTSSASKPSKLYFNSEIYHDINSLPYKPEKSRNVAAEYRKVKAPEASSDYKGYSGYFAEPSAESAEKDVASTALSSEDGYPIMNPYQYVLKKEPLPSKYEDSSSANWEQPRTKSLYSVHTSQKALEYDSYSPKFNNNPEGYGYQHSYKHVSAEREAAHGNHKYSGRHISGGKRGKRGGGQHPNAGKKNIRGASTKDIEANLALRPPPKV